MLRSEFVSDRRSRSWQIESQPVTTSEVICPQPCRISRVPLFSDTLNRSSPNTPCVLPFCKGDSCPDIPDIINSKNDLDFDLDPIVQTGFLCASPPVRTNNPLVKDGQFIRSQSQSPIVLYPLGTDLPGKKSTGSSLYKSTYSNSLKLSIESFTDCKICPHLGLSIFLFF